MSERKPIEAVERIYLQYDNGEDNPVTWAVDSIYDSDVEYIRADIHAELEKQIGAMKCCGNCEDDENSHCGGCSIQYPHLKKSYWKKRPGNEE